MGPSSSLADRSICGWMKLMDEEEGKRGGQQVTLPIRVVRSRIEDRSINLWTRIEIAIFWSLRIGRGKICIFCTFYYHFWPIEPLIEPKFEMMINTNGQNNHQCLFM